jgi:type I restriction enzyme S subunit
LKEFVIAIPPLAEQRRIVDKVGELMALCDELAVRQQAEHDGVTHFQRSALHHLTTARDQATFATGWHRVSDHFHWLYDIADSIAPLRQAILQLAVQGRLGTQDRKDEPAKGLIEQARSRWPERKVIERENWKPEEPPYELPAGWEWTCLDVLGNANPRNEADENMEVAFTPMKFISSEFGRPAAFEIRPWGAVKKGFTHFANNDVVLAKITPCFENGKSAVMRGLKNGIGAGTTELHVFRGYDGCVLPDYVLLFLKTSHFIDAGVPRMTGSAGQKRVPWDYFANSPFPLPPLAEQKRIMTRVNEIMQQCDTLELQLNDARALGTQLLDSTIHHLFVKAERLDSPIQNG